MLRTLHRYRIFFLAFLAVSSIALAFSGLGYQWFAPQRTQGAISIDDTQLSYQEVNAERQELDRLYRAQFGFNYHKMLESVGINLQQQAVDRAIQSALMDREATALGFGTGNSAVRAQLEKEFAGVPDPQEAYRMLLRDMDMTAQQFEQRLKGSLLRSQIEQAVRDASIASERETIAAVLLEKTQYSVDYLALKADGFLGEAKDPSDEDIQRYYDDNASDFEIPARASYGYAVLSPEKFLDIVEVFPDDVEIYYTDHQSDFMTAEERAVRVIELKAPPAKPVAKGSAKAASSDETTKAAHAALTKKAEELLASLKSGSAFADVAKANSKHVSASKGGELGPLSQSKLAEIVGENSAKTVFTLEMGKPSDVQVDGDVARIFLVDSITAPKPRELSEVRPEIEAIIRKREAPAFTAAKASELFDSWTSSGKALSEFISSGELASRALEMSAASGLKDKSNDPAGLKGLTEHVLEQVDEKKQLVDLGDKFVLVEVAEAKEPEVQPLASVHAAIAQTLKRRDASEIARTTAESVVDGIKNGNFKDLRAAATAAGQKLESLSGISRSQPTPPFNQGELRDMLFSSTTAMTPPSGVVLKDGTYYVLQVTKLETPPASSLQKEVLEAKDRESQQLARLVLTSLLNERKAQAKIDVEPSLLAVR